MTLAGAVGREPRRTPPRIPPLPLVGNLVDYIRDPLRFLQRSARAGDVVELVMPGMTTFLVSSPELVEQVLVTQAKSFTKDRFLKDLRRLLGDGLLTSEGDFWKRQRRLAQPAFHCDRVESYASIMVSAMEKALGAWRPGEVRDAHADMMRVTLDIVVEALFSSGIGAEAAHVGPALEAVMERYANPALALVPWMDRLPLPVNRRYHEGVRRLDDIVYGIIRRRRAGDGADARDLLSMLLAARDDDGASMPDRQLRDEVLTVFLAGHETTALALSYALHLLSKHSAADAALAEEVASVLAGRSAGLDDLPKLRFTEAVILEAMRLYPPAWALGREATCEIELGGFRLPAGAQIWISQWVMHRDERRFEAPEAFRPERWLDGLAKRLHRFAYFPFGGGPRICIGNTFAMMEATLLLASIARRFQLVDVGHALAPLPSITLRPRTGVRLRVTERRARSR